MDTDMSDYWFGVGTGVVVVLLMVYAISMSCHVGYNNAISDIEKGMTIEMMKGK